jgi:hypothetical protein
MLVLIIEFLDHFYMIRDRGGRALGSAGAIRFADGLAATRHATG